MLDIRDLSLHYGPHLALDRISVTVGKGETVVMLGANGAGKSSLLKAAAGLVRPDPGADIRFAGNQRADAFFRRVAILLEHRYGGSNEGDECENQDQGAEIAHKTPYNQLTIKRIGPIRLTKGPEKYTIY